MYGKTYYQEDGILVIPTVADPPPKLNTKNKNAVNEFLDRNYALASIASMSGCCQVSSQFLFLTFRVLNSKYKSLYTNSTGYNSFGETW